MTDLLLHIGKYYLVDAGFMLRAGFLAPYRGVRYHLKEYSKHAPENAQEIFNLRHASLRNAVERSFGILKKRFPIVASGVEAHYSFRTQTDIVLACFILHNFLKDVDPDDKILAEVDEELANAEPEETSNDHFITNECEEGVNLRANIAAQMWNDYVLNEV